jgi:lipid-binding SYLF domain-containing protein
MKTTRLQLLSAVLAMTALSGGRAAAHSPEITVRDSSEVLEAIQSIPARAIPAAMLADAQGIAIIPGVIKGGFVIGGRVGHGLVLSRNADGTWAGPAFVTLGGASVGLQAGVQSTDVILVFKTRASLDRVLRGKGKLTLGADVAVAAGPVGRQAEAGTDGNLKAEIYSYSRSRGLFAGVSLEGAGIIYDGDTNQAYARNQRPEVVQAAERLKAQVTAAGMRVPAGPPAVIMPPPGVQPVPPPPVIPPPPR